MRQPAAVLWRPDVAVPAGCLAAAGAGVGAALAVGHPAPAAAGAVLAAPAVRFAGGLPGGAASLVLAAAVVAGALAVGGPVEAAAAALTTILAAASGWWWRRDAAAHARRAEDAEQRADRFAVLDETTGTVNRHGLTLFAEQVLHEVRRRGDSVHAVLLEVNGLDDLERPGHHDVREEVMAAIADALRASTRGTDVLARWGPDTFAVVGPGSGRVPGEVERRVRVHLLDAPPVPPSLWPCRVTAGVGVLEPWDAGGLGDLLARAAEDLSLRRALRSPSAPEPPPQQV